MTWSKRKAPVPGRANRRGPVALSVRQRDVALLVAAGLVNREIGLALRIGERTVESHVAAILRKLGFRRRTQIATWLATVSVPRSATHAGASR